MRSYRIRLPRGLEVDIFNLPEDFKEQVEQEFEEYTSGTAKAYMYVNKLGFIDRCVEYLNGDKDSYDVINSLVLCKYDNGICISFVLAPNTLYISLRLCHIASSFLFMG